jgi:putative ABC transport system permease protein
MLRNYFKIAWRNLLQNKISSFINVVGLAVGMAVAILIGLWVWDELSFDSYHKNHDHIAQAMQQQTVNGNVNTFGAVPFPTGKVFQNICAGDFKYVVMSSYTGEHILSYGVKSLSRQGAYMDVDAPDLFTLKMLEGSRHGLRDPHSILLSAAAAKAIFGNSQAVNRLLKIDNKQDVKVTGVFEDLPDNSTFHGLDFIAPWLLYATTEQWVIDANKRNEWGYEAFMLYVQLADHADLEKVNKKIIHIKQDYGVAEDKKNQAKIFLNPMADWHLRSQWDAGGNRAGGIIVFVRLFSIVGMFVLLLACINFMNLSTARSEKRAKEVGIRKTIGSLRSEIIAQFYGESLTAVATSFLLSLLIAALALPTFNAMMSKRLVIPFASPAFWLITLGFVIVTGLVAGSYPALYLSSFKPVKVLKGTFKAGRFASLPRKTLVVLQFTISVALVIGTIVIYEQVQYSRNRPIGYDANGLVMIHMKTPDFNGKYELFRTELKNAGAIKEFAESSSPVTDVTTNNDDISWPGKDPNAAVDFATMWVSHDFGKTVGWQFIQGRDFSRDFASDSSAIVINEAAVKFMGLTSPVGTQIKRGSGAHEKTFTVVGVIRDMLMESPYNPVRQMVYFLDYSNVNCMLLKLNPARSAAACLAKIETVFKKYIPAAPFDYQFADASFAAKFAAEEGLGRLAVFYTTLTIFISCLGLFGLISFIAEQRTREIGIRKVLGASVFSVWRLLSKEFVLLVFVSLLIASPLAYYFMHEWLQYYPYRIELSWWIFAAAGAGVIVITMITVSFQAVRAALANPVNNLRTE